MNNPIIRFKKVDGSDFSDWKESSFQEIFEFRSSISLSRSQLNYTNGEVKNIHYGDILLKFPSIIHTDNKLIPYINQDCIPNKYDRLEKGDVVFADTAEDYSLGKAIEIGSTPFRITSGLHTIACKTKLKFASGFLVYYLNSNFYHRQINKLATGTKVYSIIKSNIIKTKLRTPSSLEEQQKIASFFSTLDQKIELNERKLEALEKLKKGLLQKIFKQELKFNHSNQSWANVCLIDIADVRDGTHDSPSYVPSGFPLVTSKNLLKNGEIDIESTNKISVSDYDNINKRSKVDVGDILFGMIGTIGRPVLVKESGFAIKNVALIKPKSDAVNNVFLYYLFRSDIIFKQLCENKTGGNQKFVSLKIIRNLLIPLPGKDEQNHIADFLSKFDKKLAIEKQRQKLLLDLKKGLMQQMFV